VTALLDGETTVLGKAEPRLSTPPLRPLTRSTSLGFEAIDFATNVLGVDLFPGKSIGSCTRWRPRPTGGFGSAPCSPSSGASKARRPC
jgi:hypothetical protein